MYPSAHFSTDAVIDLRAALYELLDWSFVVKKMSSRFRPSLLFGPDKKEMIDFPTSPSFPYHSAESMLSDGQQ